VSNASQQPPKDPPVLSLLIILVGIVIGWPWIAFVLCEMVGVCMASDSHIVDGWFRGHAMPTNALRLIGGIAGIGAGIKGLVARNPAS
jgi:hypothetical protein